jgi:predicted MFS family arabinose efflux permease
MYPAYRPAHAEPSQLKSSATTWPVAAMIAVMFMGSTLVTPLYVLYQQAFGFSDITLTLVYAAYVVGNLGALLFFGPISDRIGRRRTSLPAMGVGAISSLLFLFAQGTAWLLLARAVSGFAVGVAAGAGTAWLAELDTDKAHATVMATAGNFAGLALGVVLAGLLADFAPWPLRLSQIAYLAILGLVAVLVARARETVSRRADLGDAISVRPRLGLPADARAQFAAPAASAFATFAFIGFYAALLPSVLAFSLGEKSHAVAGAVLGMMFAISAVTVVAGRRLTSRNAMLAGVALLVPSLALLVLAEMLASMPILLGATAISGAAAALGYRGGLGVVNQIAPANRRAELVSTYMLVCFSGNSVPVIGVGALTMLCGFTVAVPTFAIVTALVAISALIVGRRYPPPT